MTFRREMNDRAGAVGSQQISYKDRIADISCHKGVTRITREAVQVAQIPRISELIQSYNPARLTAEPVEDKVRADEPGPAGDQNCVCELQSPRLFGVSIDATASEPVPCSPRLNFKLP
jgi:hypothetical protein